MTKEPLLQHLHVFNGPVSNDDIHFLAMDEHVELTRMVLVSATMATWRTVIPQLSEELDPGIIAVLTNEGAVLEKFLRAGYGSVWVTPTRIRLKVPEVSVTTGGEPRTIVGWLFKRK